jgi:hypothetical protein
LSTTITLAVAWGLSFATTYVPLETKFFFPGNVETVEVRKARFEAIERDMLEVVFDSAEPPLFEGPTGRLLTWTLLNSIVSYESGYRLDVEMGTGKYARGDNGKSVCLVQINVGTGYVTVGSNKWNADDLLKDRKKCFRAGLTAMRDSIKVCQSNPKTAWLAAYTSGSKDKGWLAAEARWNRAFIWFNKNLPSFTDADVMQALKLDKDTSKVTLK